jgi:hypothetical protein
MNEIIWVIALFLILLVLVKVEHAGKRVKLILLILIGAFLFFSMSSVLEKNSLEIDSVKNFGKAVSVYFSWLGNAAHQVWGIGNSIKDGIQDAVKSNQTKEQEWKISRDLS